MAAFYTEQHVIPVEAAARGYAEATGTRIELPETDDLLELLPPDGRARGAARALWQWLAGAGPAVPDAARLPLERAQLLVPVPRPNKLLLLAGNYAAHVEEGGEQAAQRAETFPYVFMKPPSTTLTHPGRPVRIPAVSPAAIDYEAELGVVIGRTAKGVREADALDFLAGYTVINDISDRRFRPNPQRKPRAKDEFFDWMHGKWHDGSCPCGPCITASDAVPDPQRLAIELRVDGQLRQDASTAAQVFPVAAVIAFLSSFVTLEPGDIISTGTPAGVGHTAGSYLKPGNVVEATIESIGTLVSPMVAAGEHT
jgi:2-keto-4-pentenoate hydratase/2-oxohepta-3-ene-1,7-dioic acid hydratase in catechol pathway